MPRIPCQRHRFSIPEDQAYFNCAYTSPLADTPRQAALDAVASKTMPWNISAENFFSGPEMVRERFGAIIGASPDSVAIIPGVSYGIAIAAASLPLQPGQGILVLEDQFPSNIYSWRKKAATSGGHMVTVPTPADKDWTSAVLEKLQPCIGIAALPHCHWTDGARLDLAAIGRKCRELGTCLVIDGSQSLGAMPFSVEEIQPDFVATAGHKWLLGAYSYSYLYVAPQWVETATPMEENWLNREGSEDLSRLVEYRDGYRPGARKLDFGECSSFMLAPVNRAALDLLLEWTVPAIAMTIKEHTDQVVERARELGLGTIPESCRSPHMTGVTVRKPITNDFVRAFKKDNVHVSLRGQSIRIAPHVYTTQQDLDRLFAVLEKHA